MNLKGTPFGFGIFLGYFEQFRANRKSQKQNYHQCFYFPSRRAPPGTNLESSLPPAFTPPQIIVALALKI